MTVTIESEWMSPFKYFFLWWKTSVTLPFSVNNYFFEIISDCQISSIRWIFCNIDVRSQLWETIFTLRLIKIIVVEMPNFDTSWVEICIFFLRENSLRATSSYELIVERMEVDWKYSLFLSVPSNIGRNKLHCFNLYRFNKNGGIMINSVLLSCYFDDLHF